MVDDVTNEMTDDMTEQEWCLPTVTDSTGTASSPQWIILKLQRQVTRSPWTNSEADMCKLTKNVSRFCHLHL